jgi:hypothetical protein
LRIVPFLVFVFLTACGRPSTHASQVTQTPVWMKPGEHLLMKRPPGYTRTYLVDALRRAPVCSGIMWTKSLRIMAVYEGDVYREQVFGDALSAYEFARDAGARRLLALVTRQKDIADMSRDDIVALEMDTNVIGYAVFVTCT